VNVSKGYATRTDSVQDRDNLIEQSPQLLLYNYTFSDNTIERWFEGGL